jgi:hypothetical protein
MRFKTAAAALGLIGLTLGVSLPARASLPADASPAAGAAAPGWRVSKVFGPADPWGQWLVPLSANDAWSVAVAGPDSYDVDRWTGTSWKQLPVPAALDKTGPLAVGASSASNLWIINANGTADRWNGSKWQTIDVPQWAERDNPGGGLDIAVAVPGPNAVWVFSLAQNPTQPMAGDAALYNGHTWLKEALPVIPDDVQGMWISGEPVKGGAWEIAYWNGKSWQALHIPAISTPTRLNLLTLAAPVTATDYWLYQVVGTGKWYLVHVTGKQWRRFSPPPATTIGGPVAPDGSGGAWLVSRGRAPSYTWGFYHLSSSGHWTKYAVPLVHGLTLPLSGIAWVPGTKSVWATGDWLGPSGPYYGAIYGYGQ